MPKMKTKRALAKRVKVTGSGKLKRWSAYTSHLSHNKSQKQNYEKYRCEVCDYIYDPAKGDPDGGIAPGTAFEDLPADWVCPVCGVGKEDFVEEP